MTIIARTLKRLLLLALMLLGAHTLFASPRGVPPSPWPVVHGKAVGALTPWAPNAVYITATASGGNTGADCANAKALSYFTSSGNWSATPTGIQIGPDTTVHFCGTFTGTPGTTLWSTLGAGTSGHEITLLMESGAGFTATYWPAVNNTGAINIAHSYIILDGGTNGYLESSANGTSLANQQDSEGVTSLSAVHDVEVKNLTIRTMCVRSAGSSDQNCLGVGIRFYNTGENISIHDNTISDVLTGIQTDFTAAVNVTVGPQIYNNSISKRNEAVNIGVCMNNTIGGVKGYNNHIGSAVEWDHPSDHYHHDGFHAFACPGNTGVLSGQFYNNLMDGDMGTFSTGLFFFEDMWDSVWVFNNLLVPTGSGFVNDGLILFKGGTNGRAYNNTVICPAGGAGIGLSNSTGNNIRNNIVQGCTTGINHENAGASGYTIDYNVYYNITQWTLSGLIYSSFASWKAACSCDSHSSTSTPNLNGSYIPVATSSAIDAGVDLSGLSITALNSDKAGNARSAPWTIGALDEAGGGDVTGPVAGASGAITFASVTSTALTVNWTKATDETTAQGSLQYEVCRLASTISSVGTCESNIVLSFTADIATFADSGLSSSTTYHYNVVVKDAAGNKTLYVDNSQATSASVLNKKISPRKFRRL